MTLPTSVSPRCGPIGRLSTVAAAALVTGKRRWGARDGRRRQSDGGVSGSGCESMTPQVGEVPSQPIPVWVTYAEDVPNLGKCIARALGQNDVDALAQAIEIHLGNRSPSPVPAL